MKNSYYNLNNNKKSRYVVVGSVFLLSLILAVQFSPSAYASSDAYNSGYEHGCDDAGISDPDDRYINQPEKGPSFHTGSFMRGYDDGFYACSGNYGGSNVLENARDCYDAGYEDGQDFPLDSGANDFCRQFTDDRGNPYYTGFVDGCMAVEGNTIDVCESSTD